MEGIVFVHPLRDVRDAFGFVIGAAYRDWFFRNSRLLGLYRRLEDGGEFQGRGTMVTVSEDFVWQWENAFEPEREHQPPHGYWCYHPGHGWDLEGYGQDF